MGGTTYSPQSKGWGSFSRVCSNGERKAVNLFETPVCVRVEAVLPSSKHAAFLVQDKQHENHGAGESRTMA